MATFMTRHSLGIAIVALSSIGCWNPFSPARTNEFTWTVDGQTFQASSNGIGALHTSGQWVSIDGANCSSHAGVDIQVNGPSVGTFTADKLRATWTPNASNGDIAAINWALETLPQSGVGFLTGSGSLTISSYSDRGIAGTFDLVLIPSRGNPDRTNRSVQGKFDVGFGGGPIC